MTQVLYPIRLLLLLVPFVALGNWMRCTKPVTIGLHGDYFVTCPNCGDEFNSVMGKTGTGGGVGPAIGGNPSRVIVHTSWAEFTCPRCSVIVVSVTTSMTTNTASIQ